MTGLSSLSHSFVPHTHTLVGSIVFVCVCVCVRSVSDPDSPEYLRFKSVDELEGIIGAPQSDISEASAWLASLDG